MGDMADYYREGAIDQLAAEDSKELALREPTLSPQLTDGPSYFPGFDGAAEAPFEERIQAVLGEPVDERDVKIRPDDGMIYLSGDWYRSKLTRAFGRGGWSLAPRSQAKLMGTLVVYHGALICLKQYVTEAVGECNYNPTNAKMTYADALEGAKTICLSRCCKYLEMDREIRNKDWADAWIRKWARKDGPADRRGNPTWRKLISPTAADKPTTTTTPAPAPRDRPKPPEPTPIPLEDLLLKCEVARECIGQKAFDDSLALFKVKTAEDVPADKREAFLTYLRKWPIINPPKKGEPK